MRAVWREPERKLGGLNSSISSRVTLLLSSQFSLVSRKRRYDNALNQVSCLWLVVAVNRTRRPGLTTSKLLQ